MTPVEARELADGADGRGSVGRVISRRRTNIPPSYIPRPVTELAVLPAIRGTDTGVYSSGSLVDSIDGYDIGASSSLSASGRAFADDVLRMMSGADVVDQIDGFYGHNETTEI